MSDEKIPELVALKQLLDSLEGKPIPFNLHVHIRDVQKDLERSGY